MTDKERKLALYCLKASSDYHSEVCDECINYPNCDHMVQDDVTETIIKALEQEPCSDAVSRQAVFEQINCWIGSGEYRYTNATDYLNKRIKALQAVNPQPKTGHWILHSTTEHGLREDSYYTCSNCRSDYYTEHNYCPNCGVKMVESSVSEVEE